MTFLGIDRTLHPSLDEINFLQAGTGAVQRDAQSKMRDIVSVKDFGAEGDGVMDDRTAINNSNTAASGRRQILPSGTYQMGSALAFADTDRLYFENGASFSGTAPTGGLREYELARSTAVAGSKMKIEKLFENSSFLLEDEASIWVAKTQTFFGVSREFISSDGGAGSPTVAFFAFANNNNSPADVAAILGDAVARTNDDVVFAANLIARNAGGTTGTKLVGLEIDVEPAVGTTISTESGGLFLNMFNITGTGIPGILFGGVGGGKWADGIVFNAIENAALSMTTGATTCISMLDSRNGTFSGPAIRLGRGINQSIQLGVGAFGNDGFMYLDTSNNLIIQTGDGGFIGFKKADGTTEATFAAGGIWDINGAYRVDGTQVVTNRQTGWTDQTASASRADLGGAPTTAALASFCRALYDDLKTHGLIGN